MHESVNSSGTPSSNPHLDDIRLVQRRKRCRDLDRRREPDRQRARHGLEEDRRCIWKRIASQRPHHHDRNPSTRHVDGRLRQQNDVAAVEIDVLVGRVEPRRLASDRPVG